MYLNAIVLIKTSYILHIICSTNDHGYSVNPNRGDYTRTPLKNSNSQNVGDAEIQTFLHPIPHENQEENKENIKL